MKEQAIIDTTRMAFKEATGGALDVQVKAREAIRPFDLELRLELRQHQEILLATLKNEVRMPDVPLIIALFGETVPDQNRKKVLLAQYIPGPVKDALKKNHINYLEAAGNCFIDLDNLFIYVSNRKTAGVRKTGEGKLWNKTGLKYVFAVLANPQLLDFPLRVQATTAGIALGNLPALREALLAQLHRGSNSADVRLWEQLMERWGLQYHQTLKPALKLGTFRFLKTETKADWETLKVPEQTWWGGENAAALITTYLRPKEFTIFTRNKTRVMAQWKLLPDEDGDVHLYEPFWPVEQDPADQSHVHPILVWTDLHYELDQRLRETAERIRKTIAFRQDD
jgi:hypothetical protein